MEENDIIERLNIFISESELSRSQFADSCGIPRPTVTQILSGKNKKIGNDIIECIHRTYPTIPMMWLIFGEGEKPAFKRHDELPEISFIGDESTYSSVEPSHNAPIQPPTAAELPINQVLVKQKEISKIVVFYTDNSFEEYFLKR